VWLLTSGMPEPKPDPQIHDWPDDVDDWEDD
jgi:hypothetical protein